MNKTKAYLLSGLTVLSACMLSACDSAFSTHPYDVRFSGDTDLNAAQIARIEAATAGRDTLRVAVISDTHGWYADTEDEIADINRRAEVDFVIHCGDLTDTGTQLEYEWIRRLLRTLDVPCVALLGNHDCLGSGMEAYRALFGPADFAFTAAGIRIICLNTNATEYDYMAAVPNFGFLEQQLGIDSVGLSVVVMHAPPYSDQFNNNVATAFRGYLALVPRLACCIYGHNHNTTVSHYYNDSLTFYGVGSAQKRQYRVFTFYPNGYEQEVVDF